MKKKHPAKRFFKRKLDWIIIVLADSGLAIQNDISNKRQFGGQKKIYGKRSPSLSNSIPLQRHFSGNFTTTPK
jgi:hypothetical protein